MVEEIKQKFVGEWIHTQDDLLPQFFDAVGATDSEKQFMLSSTPCIIFEMVDDDTIRLCDTPYPEDDPDSKADVNFQLDKEFTFEPRGHCFQVIVSMKEGRMIQSISPVQSHTAAHTIQLSVEGNELVQVYKTTDSTGNDVTGTRRYNKKTATP